MKLFKGYKVYCKALQLDLKVPYLYVCLFYLKCHGVAKSQEDSQGKRSLVGPVAPQSVCTSSNTKSTYYVAQRTWKKVRGVLQWNCHHYIKMHFTPMRAESLGYHVPFLTFWPSVSFKKCWECAGQLSHFGCSKTDECMSLWGPDRTSQDLRSGGSLATIILLWCYEPHNGMSLGGVNVFCLLLWNYMQISLEKRAKNVQSQRGDRVEIVVDLCHTTTVHIYRSHISVNQQTVFENRNLNISNSGYTLHSRSRGFELL